MPWQLGLASPAMMRYHERRRLAAEARAARGGHASMERLVRAIVGRYRECATCHRPIVAGSTSSPERRHRGCVYRDPSWRERVVAGHRARLVAVDRTCGICGTSFTAHEVLGGTATMYCSRRCRRRAHKGFLLAGERVRLTSFPEGPLREIARSIHETRQEIDRRYTNHGRPEDRGAAHG